MTRLLNALDLLPNAAGVSDVTKAQGALLVLGVNIVMLLTGGCLTLLVQRWLAERQSITRKG